MAKFVMECPSCGRYAEASTGFMGIGKTRNIHCNCGYVINVASEKMGTRTCAHCGNKVVFDQAKGEKALCPVCHEHINTQAYLHNLVQLSCPTCNCNLAADQNAARYTCPICDTVVDVQAEIKKADIRKEGLVSVIKYEGDADTLIWKHPIEDFNTGSQLIVHESQEAIFFRDGQALDLFGAGRYLLETGSLPILEKIYQLPTGANQLFHSEVYYINMAQQMALKWGTSEKITLIDPTSQAPIAIGARGIFNFKVSNSRKLLLKLVGTTNTLNRNDIFGGDAAATKSHAKDYFRSVVQLGVSTKLAEIITSQNIDILQIDQQKLALSDALKASLLSYFDDYGMEITEFLVEGIILPQPGELGYDVVQTLIKLRQANLQKSVIATETDIKLTEMEAKKTIDIRGQENAAEVERAHQGLVTAKGETSVMEAQWEGQRKLAETQADVQADRLRMQLEMERKAQTAQIEAEEMRAKGYNQKDVLQADVMKAFAENQPEGGGMNMSGMAGSAMQAGMGFATMGAMAGMATNMMGTGAQIGAQMTGAMNQAMNGVTGGINGQSATAPGGFNLNNGTMNMGAAGVNGVSVSGQGDTSGWNCSCGATGITSKFCPECGNPKPEAPTAWNCSCGAMGITSKFCPECGSPKPESPTAWNCSCGATGITSKFCPECGNKKA